MIQCWGQPSKNFVQKYCTQNIYYTLFGQSWVNWQIKIYLFSDLLNREKKERIHRKDLSGQANHITHTQTYSWADKMRKPRIVTKQAYWLD